MGRKSIDTTYEYARVPEPSADQGLKMFLKICTLGRRGRGADSKMVALWREYEWRVSLLPKSDIRSFRILSDSMGQVRQLEQESILDQIGHVNLRRSQRMCSALPQKVYQAFLGLEAAAAWHFPNAMLVHVDTFDPRDGNFRMSLTFQNFVAPSCFLFRSCDPVPQL